MSVFAGTNVNSELLPLKIESKIVIPLLSLSILARRLIAMIIFGLEL